MKLWEMSAISLLRLSFFSGVLGYAVIVLTPAGWGLFKAGFILTAFAGVAFCFYLFRRWPREWEGESPVKKILCALGFILFALFAAGVVFVSVVSLFS